MASTEHNYCGITLFLPSLASSNGWGLGISLVPAVTGAVRFTPKGLYRDGGWSCFGRSA